MDSNDDRCMDRVFTVDLEDESAVGALIVKRFIPASFLWEVTGFLRIIIAVLPEVHKEKTCKGVAACMES